jgi:hypothetical protein
MLNRPVAAVSRLLIPNHLRFIWHLVKGFSIDWEKRSSYTHGLKAMPYNTKLPTFD